MEYVIIEAVFLGDIADVKVNETVDITLNRLTYWLAGFDHVKVTAIIHLPTGKEAITVTGDQATQHQRNVIVNRIMDYLFHYPKDLDK